MKINPHCVSVLDRDLTNMCNAYAIGPFAVTNPEPAFTSTSIKDPLIDTSGIHESIPENSNALGVVSSNSPVTWAIEGEDASNMSVSHNGTVMLNSNADYDIKNSYSFNVLCRDALGNSSKTATLHTYITDIP